MKNAFLTALIALAAGFYGCNQTQQTVSPDADAAVNSTARLASDSSGFFFRKKFTKIDVNELPAAVTSYITGTYSGATVEYAAKDDTGNFWVAITQNVEVKALVFNADGSFNEEVALKDGKGRPGGPRGKGPGKKSQLETISVADLPTAITEYINANYAGAELKAAAKDSARGYLVMVVVSEKAKTLLFNTDGTFNREISKPLHGKFTNVPVADLPASVTTYISQQHTGSTIKEAAKNEVGEWIVWLKTSDGKPVTLLFATDGTFKQVLKQRH
ncbi:hypothetical protein GCM10027347_24800 [Larkinella harenae]